MLMFYNVYNVYKATWRPATLERNVTAIVNKAWDPYDSQVWDSEDTAGTVTLEA